MLKIYIYSLVFITFSICTAKIIMGPRNWLRKLTESEQADIRKWCPPSTADNTVLKMKKVLQIIAKILNLETTLIALSALISFTAVVPQVRRLLCDHGYIQDNSKKPISIDRFGRRLENQFVKDEWVNHREMVLEEYENEKSLPAIACVSNLFIEPFVGDYKKMQIWSGLEKKESLQSINTA